MSRSTLQDCIEIGHSLVFCVHEVVGSIHEIYNMQKDFVCFRNVLPIGLKILDVTLS